MPKPIPLLFKVNWNACIQCGACIAVCPQKAGFVSPFNTISVNDPCHIACLNCQEVCPVTAITHRQAILTAINA